MSAARTPGPWNARKPAFQESMRIMSADCDIVAGVVAEPADAAFIVQACNAHDELVAALQRALRAHTDAPALEPAWCAQARAALAKAEA